MKSYVLLFIMKSHDRDRQFSPGPAGVLMAANTTGSQAAVIAAAIIYLAFHQHPDLNAGMLAPNVMAMVLAF
jgi:hypothetical protein